MFSFLIYSRIVLHIPGLHLEIVLRGGKTSKCKVKGGAKIFIECGPQGVLEACSPRKIWHSRCSEIACYAFSACQHIQSVVYANPGGGKNLSKPSSQIKPCIHKENKVCRTSALDIVFEFSGLQRTLAKLMQPCLAISKYCTTGKFSEHYIILRISQKKHVMI